MIALVRGVGTAAMLWLLGWSHWQQVRDRCEETGRRYQPTALSWARKIQLPMLQKLERITSWSKLESLPSKWVELLRAGQQ
jgi:hypothetical protein